MLPSQFAALPPEERRFVAASEKVALEELARQ